MAFLCCRIEFVGKKDIYDYRQEVNNHLQVCWKEDFLPCLSEKSAIAIEFEKKIHQILASKLHCMVESIDSRQD